jgi:hypothetical protein
MAVRAQTEVYQVEHRRRSGDAVKSASVPAGSPLQVEGLDRHRMDLPAAKRNALQQALAQMGEVSIRMPGWGDPLIDLNDVDPIPRHLFGGESAQHEPGSVPPADGDYEPAARGNRQPSLLCDHASGFFGDGVRAGQHFDVHLGLRKRGYRE